ncbi:MAG: ATP-binding domain-containing protein [Myxococcales bacterium]|nr:ATP-binding domain-containing protein [Myxococcales bacterium]
MPDRIVSEELKLLERVAGALATAPERHFPSEASLVEELEQVREQLLRGQGDEFERAALSDRWNNLTALRRQLEESRNAPVVDPSSPYFAHLRLREGDRERDLCLGKATCLENGLRIVDWRHAPIAKLFYRYQQGDDYEEEVSGRMLEGEVVTRRTVAIHQSALERIDAPEGTFLADPAEPDGWRRISREAPKLAGGEGAALRVHTEARPGDRSLGTDPGGGFRRADKHLPDIAGLIDPKQFSLIARPSAGFVAIRGTAGSGKTTVALHRIAYLAYDDPVIDSAQTLFLVFSPALRDYVSHVLPALGVERVRVLTFREWALEQRKRLFPALPTRTREDTPEPVMRLKLHPALLAALERQVTENPGPATAARAVDDWLSVLVNRPLLEELLDGRTDGRPSFSERELRSATEWCRARQDELLSWVDGDRDVPGELDPEDDALLLHAYQLRVGPIIGAAKVPLEYRHLAIDEVQDFAALEVRVLLGCLDSRKSLTLAGDTQQHVIAGSGFTSWSEFFTDLGIDGTAIETLQVSYRSSREITEFALELLGNLREPDPVITDRGGPPVEVFEFTDSGACVAFLAEALTELAVAEPLASVAVLTPDAETSELYERWLAQSDVPRVHRVTEQDFRFAPGVEVSEIQQVKGLEFDYVILVDVDDENYTPGDPSRRILHVGATRAVHQLWVASVGRVSRLVREASDRARKLERS